MRHLEEHLDDGIIHALLDGELEGEGLAAARAHVAECASCAARVADERLLMGEAERLIAELDEPAAPADIPASGPAAAAPQAPDAPRVQGSPVVLIPDVEPSRWQRRRGPSRAIGIAATLAVAAGAGFFALRGNGSPTSFAEDSVVSDIPAPLPVPESRGFALTDSGVPASESIETSASQVPGAEPVPTESIATVPQAPVTARSDAAPDDPVAAAKAAEPESPPAPVRDERTAAPALQRERGNQTVPAGEADARTEIVVAPPSPTAVAPAASARDARTDDVARGATSSGAARARESESLEQRAQITMRIGLDEAQRLLGGPMHVIDGLRHEFVGLVPGRLMRGANPNNYAVRVVYLDEAGRPFFLDQQRLDTTDRQLGAQRDSIPPEWVRGDVRLAISGALSTEAAAGVAARVR